MNNMVDYLPDSFQISMRELLRGEYSNSPFKRARPSRNRERFNAILATGGADLNEELLYDAFVAGFSEPSKRGLRLNLLKIAGDKPGDIVPGPLTPVPWCPEGFLYPPGARPAKNLAYNAGLFYIQEPSAMSPAVALRPKPGQRVLDICAAPGGKSVQLAGYMQGSGVLVSNDISPARSRALVKNLELAGVTNAVVLTEKPNRLAGRFPLYFDCILVDAPCSGEGMFRRDPDAVKAYTANKPESCAVLQQEILRSAAAMLKPGGRMVYSTCTFNTVENEGTVSAFLAAHPDFELLGIDHEGLGLSHGRAGLDRAARIWPHLSPGEGHFIALLGKKGESEAGHPCEEQSGEATRQGTSYTKTKGKPAHKKPPQSADGRLPDEFRAFCEENLNGLPFAEAGRVIHRHGNSIFLQPGHMDLNGLRVARSGWLLGECAKGRFVPSQAMAMGIRAGQARYAVDLPEADALRYLKGETLSPDAWAGGLAAHTGKPWVLVCLGGFPLGWARLVQGRLKNQLPTSWVVS